MSKMRLILLLLLALLIIGSVLFYWLRAPSQVNVRLSVPGGGAQANGENGGNSEAAEPQAREVTYDHVENGVHKWGLVAKGGNYDMDNDTIYLKDVRIIFYGESGEIHIRGDEGEYNQARQTVVLIGNVRGRNPKGVTLQTQRLTYSEIEQIIDTDDQWATVAGPTFSITGQGMKVHVPSQHITFKEKVDSTFLPQESNGEETPDEQKEDS